MIGANDADPGADKRSGGSSGTGARRTFNERIERRPGIGAPGVGGGTPAEGGVGGTLMNVDCSQDGVASPALSEFGARGLLIGKEDGTSTRDGSSRTPDRALIRDGRPVVDEPFSSGLVKGDEFSLPSLEDRD